MSSVNSQGSRLFYAPTATAWVDLAAGATPANTFVQVLNLVDVDPKPNNIEEYDDSSLEDTAPVPAMTVKPGSISFTKKKNSQSKTLLDFCDGTTKKVWAVLYLDGTAQTVTGRLKVSSGGRANAGDFKAKAQETYEVVGDTVLAQHDHA